LEKFYFLFVIKLSTKACAKHGLLLSNQRLQKDFPAREKIAPRNYKTVSNNAITVLQNSKTLPPTTPARDARESLDG
jgi:hypothetical protein